MGMLSHWRLNLAQRLILILAMMMGILLGAGTLIFYHNASSAVRANQQEMLLTMAKAAASFVDADEHSSIYQAKRENTESYLKLQSLLQRFRDANPHIRFVYTMVPAEGNKWNFVMDAEPSSSSQHSAIGSEYTSNSQEFLQALQGPVAQKEFYKDQYGTWLSGFAPIKDSSGKTQAILGVDISASDILSQESVLRMTAIAIFILSLLALWLATELFVRRAILPPINNINALLQEARQGVLTKRIKSSSQDELGHMALGFNSFIESFHKIISGLVGDADHVASASESLLSVSVNLADGSTLMDSNASSIAESMGEMSHNLETISTTIEESSGRVQSIATATEEMTATISDISQNAREANQVTMEAVGSMQDISERMNVLSNAAKEISQVITLIDDIAEQTKLLALNATIEAARAGEAGKGFAVVATEVKALANQTGQTTEDIRQKIAGIQRSALDAEAEIARITGIVGRVNEITTTISQAVSEQSVATSDISLNLSRVSVGVQEVAQKIVRMAHSSKDIASNTNVVSGTSGDITVASKHLNSQAQELNEMGSALKRVVRQFTI